MASLLYDEGHEANFERCLKVVMTLRGDIARAREVLAQIATKEKSMMQCTDNQFDTSNWKIKTTDYED